jgi:uncharacterized membrane protein (UPF0127 family)
MDATHSDICYSVVGCATEARAGASGEAISAQLRGGAVSQKPPNGAVVAVRNLTRGTTVGNDIRVARSFMARGRGLMFVSELEPDSGLLIDPCSSIHMFFMRIPLDVLYCDRQHRVVRAQQEIKPWRIGPLHTRGASYVIELPVGTIERSGSAVGDQLQIDVNSHGEL